MALVNLAIPSYIERSYRTRDGRVVRVIAPQGNSMVLVRDHNGKEWYASAYRVRDALKAREVFPHKE